MSLICHNCGLFPDDCICKFEKENIWDSESKKFHSNYLMKSPFTFKCDSCSCIYTAIHLYRIFIHSDVRSKRWYYNELICDRCKFSLHS